VGGVGLRRGRGLSLGEELAEGRWIGGGRRSSIILDMEWNGMGLFFVWEDVYVPCISL
jgi:hypothetical protein